MRSWCSFLSWSGTWGHWWGGHWGDAGLWSLTHVVVLVKTNSRSSSFTQLTTILHGLSHLLDSSNSSVIEKIWVMSIFVIDYRSGLIKSLVYCYSWCFDSLRGLCNLRLGLFCQRSDCKWNQICHSFEVRPFHLVARELPYCNSLCPKTPSLALNENRACH